VLRALDHPAVCAMGHPTTRRLGQRDAVAMDLEAVFERAAARGVAMEISAQPDRTDLDDVNARRAHELGVTLTINTDAHAVSHYDLMRYGVFAARRAGLTKQDVLNTLPWSRFEERVAGRTKRAAHGTAATAKAARTAGPRKQAVTAPKKVAPAKPAARRPAAKPAAKKSGKR